MATILARNGTVTRLAWVPGHTNSDGATRLQTMQQGSVFLVPLLHWTTTRRAPLLTRAFIQLDHARQEQKVRLASVTPHGNLALAPPMPHSAEIFTNKTRANATLTTHITRKWLHPAGSPPP